MGITATVSGYMAGYALDSSFPGQLSQIDVTTSGYIGAFGVKDEYESGDGPAYRIVNLGKVVDTGSTSPVNSQAGLYFTDGGSVTNGNDLDTTARIQGAGGVQILGGVATVNNYGTIASRTVAAGVSLSNGGTVTNGGASDVVASIVGGSGVQIDGAGQAVINFGSIMGVYGAAIALTAAGAAVYNGEAADTGALIQGQGGVKVTGGTGAVTNYGTIASTTAVNTTGQVAAVDLAAGGRVVNGSAADTGALITGLTGLYLPAGGTLQNFGSIVGTTYFGILTFAGAISITNGSKMDKAAAIEGYRDAIYTEQSATVTNFGALTGLGPYDGVGLFLYDGGGLTNGSLTDRTADIAGGSVGVLTENNPSTIVNFATIASSDASAENPGVDLRKGGAVTNGAAGDTAALISGGNGVTADGPATVTNFGSIAGAVGFGVYLDAGGKLTNGSQTDRLAQVSGGNIGAAVMHAAGTIVNFATIAGGGAEGVELTDGGSVVNGAAGDAVALITGDSGVDAAVAATVANFGSIVGQYGAAITLAHGGSVTNGGVTDGKARIDGYTGVSVKGAMGTVTNFGVIHGSGATAGSLGVYLYAGGTLINGSAIDTGATVAGYGGVGAKAGEATIDNLGTIEGYGNQSETLVSAVGLADGGVVINGSTKDTRALIEGYAGVTALAGATVTNFGTIAGQGGVAVSLGAASSELVVEAGSAFEGSVSGGGGTLALAGGVGTLSGAFSVSGLTVSGSMAPTTFQAFDTVQINAGATFTDADPTTTLAAGRKLIDAGSLTLSGAVANAGTITISGGVLNVAAAGLSLTGAGAVVLNAGAVNVITGSVSAATLTLGQALEGAGQLGAGHMSLTVTSAGTVESLGASALTLNTGANATANAGIIESAGTGGATIASAVVNTGRLIASSGTLTVSGAVSGTGYGQVNAGTLDFAAGSTFNQKVVFASGATGTLELANSQTYAGTISGFSLTGATRLDLVDIAYAAGTTTASYAGTASAGVLTVTSGAEVAKIHLTGNYLASTWTLSSDGHGGTDIVDPAKTPAPKADAFIQAAAAMDGATSAALSPAHARDEPLSPMLATPGRAATGSANSAIMRA